LIYGVTGHCNKAFRSLLPFFVFHDAKVGHTCVIFKFNFT
jgi:hypothetical protein